MSAPTPSVPALPSNTPWYITTALGALTGAAGILAGLATQGVVPAWVGGVAGTVAAIFGTMLGWTHSGAGLVPPPKG